MQNTLHNMKCKKPKMLIRRVLAKLNNNQEYVARRDAVSQQLGMAKSFLYFGPKSHSVKVSVKPGSEYLTKRSLDAK